MCVQTVPGPSTMHKVTNTYSSIMLSIKRAKTNDSDTAEQLIQKAKASFQAKQAQTNFREHFTPTKHLLVSQKSLAGLKAKCATI